MNILILSKDYPPTIGGVETYSYHIAEGLSVEHEVQVISFQGEKTANSWEDSIPVRRISRVISSELFKAFQLFFVLFSHLRKNDVDLVYATTWKVGIPYAILKFVYRKNFFVVCHGAEITRHKSKPMLMSTMKWVLGAADRLISVSDFTKSKILEYTNVDQSKIHVIPNGVDVSKLSPIDKSMARSKLGLDENVFLVLTVSRIDKRKGHELVLRALSKLSSTNINIKYIIVGNGPEKGRLIQLVKKLDLEDYVIFTGFISTEELDLYYSAVDVFAMINTMDDDTDFEGFGLVFAEAGYYSLPLIGGDNSGPKEVIIENETGYLVDTNIDKIAEKIELLFSDEDLRINMGRKAKEITSKEFSLEKLLDRMKDNLRAI